MHVDDRDSEQILEDLMDVIYSFDEKTDRIVDKKLISKYNIIKDTNESLRVHSAPSRESAIIISE